MMGPSRIVHDAARSAVRELSELDAHVLTARPEPRGGGSARTGR